MSELSEYERLRKEEQDYLNGLSNTNTDESTEPQSLDESSRLRKEEQDYLDSLRVDTPSVYEPPEQQTVLAVDAEEPKFDNYGAPLEAEKNDEDGDGDENNFGEEPKPSTPVVLFSLAPAVGGDSFNKTENEDKAVHTDVDLNPTTPQPASRNDELNDPDASSNSSSIDGESPL